MIKISENKTRKNLRLTLCVFYLFQIVLCSFPFIQGADSKGAMHSYSILDLISYIGGTASDDAFLRYVLYTPIVLIIPIIGFFFCALDKERNLKNLVSLFCCAFGIISILFIAGAMLSLGSLISLLLYLLMSFLTTISIFARFQKDETDEKTKK